LFVIDRRLSPFVIVQVPPKSHNGTATFLLLSFCCQRYIKPIFPSPFDSFHQFAISRFKVSITFITTHHTLSFSSPTTTSLDPTTTTTLTHIPRITNSRITQSRLEMFARSLTLAIAAFAISGKYPRSRHRYHR
jgi:hypothetical protein